MFFTILEVTPHKHVPKQCFAYLFDSGGRGSLVIQTAIETSMKCVGVELSAKRHAMAVAAKNRLDQVAKVSVNEVCYNSAVHLS